MGRRPFSGLSVFPTLSFFTFHAGWPEGHLFVVIAFTIATSTMALKEET
jgi:hypothetical protein